jgi:hypothetical protein
MARPGDFSVLTAGGLVLGGVAALLLATAVASGGYGRPKGRAASDGASAATSSSAPRSAAANPLGQAGGAVVHEADLEYLLDTSEDAPTHRETP